MERSCENCGDNHCICAGKKELLACVRWSSIAPTIEPLETTTGATATSRYERIGAEIGQLVINKQKAYGDMIRGAQDIFRILYPDGIKPEQYDDALLVLRVMDKVGRICRGEKKAFGESPWRDICGYSILGAEQDSREETK